MEAPESDPPPNHIPSGEATDGPAMSEVRSYFVRHRNALLVRAQFGEIYTDHYLHLMQHGLKLAPDHDRRLKEAIAAITLHVSGKPWHQVSAWTINFVDPPLNLFVTGDSIKGRVVGRVFTENVREAERGLFSAQVSDRDNPVRNSMIDLDSGEVFSAVEEFYLKSEQLPGRFFEYAPDDYVFLVAQPGFDETWFQELTVDAIRSLDQDEELSLLETRSYRYDCGCNLDRILAFLRGSNDIEELFGEDEILTISCPRCGAIFAVTRKDISLD